MQKNRRLKPSDVAAFSKEEVWWQCLKSNAHVWSERVGNRTSKKLGCPFCAGHRIAADNNLAVKYPAAVKLWHPTRNLPLTPYEVTAGTAKVVWWRCFRSAKHIWKASIVTMVRAHRHGHNGCPFCAGRKVGPDNSLAAKHPDVARMWHPRNLPALPSEFTAGAPDKVWWQCPNVQDHAWKATISNIVRAQKYTSRGCPYCSGHQVAKENSLKFKYPEVAKYWDKSRNLALRPKQVTCMSNKKAFWRCDRFGDHVWESSVCYMVVCWNKGRMLCPFCREKGRANRKKTG